MHYVESLKKAKNMKKLLKKYFGYDQFRPLQEEIINNVVNKKDTFVLMPTGGGKSLCFQLPALKFSGITLVISPLIALMKDQVDNLKKNGISADFLNSTQSEKEQNEIGQKLKNNETKLLYVAPERLALPGFQEFLKTLNINLIAIDEAHCISEWGHDFRPDYRNLKILKNIFPGTPIIALTATATPRVQEDIVGQLSLQKAKIFISSFNRENLNISIINKEKAFNKLTNLLAEYKNKSVIIYCFSRNDTEKITEKLNKLGFNALPYHAGLNAEIRKKNQNMFIKDSINIMVATIAFGMGIDKPDVRLVVHYTFPKTLESYYQEIGRAGRDNLPSECVMFYTYADTRKHEFFIGQINDKKMRETAQNKLNEVLEFAEGNVCRKKHLLKYFGEELHENCNTCDACLTDEEKFDATVIAQKIISAILRTEERFGKNHIIDVLLGKNTQQIRRYGHDKISVFGIVNNINKDKLAQIIKSLLDLNLIQKSTGQYPTISITNKGKLFIKNKEKLELNKPRQDKFSDKKLSIEVEYDTALFEKLRVIRKHIAERENIPPFMIFGDKTLHQMAHCLPAEKNTFSSLYGVGELKLQKYSDIFIKEIKKYIKENNINIKKIQNSQKMNRQLHDVNNVVNQKYYQTTIELLQKKTNLKNIAKHQNLKVSTIVNHIEKIIDDEINIDLEYLKLPRDRFESIKKAFTTCEDEKLKPVFELLDGKYDYDEIRLVRALLNTQITSQ